MHYYRWETLSHSQESHLQELCCPTSLAQRPAMAIDLEMTDLALDLIALPIEAPVPGSAARRHLL